VVEAADASHISEKTSRPLKIRLASPPSLMRKKTRTIIALSISWELFQTKEIKEVKLYFDPSPRFGSRPETDSTRVGGGDPETYGMRF